MLETLEDRISSSSIPDAKTQGATAAPGHGVLALAGLRVVDMTLYPTPDLTGAMSAAGIKDFTLGFIVADPRNHKPSWGGYSTDDINGGAYDMAMRSQVSAVRQQGGDVMVSFGGAAGKELAQVITNVKKLENAYQTVITDYNLTQIDFDIEGAAEANHASINRRFRAVAALEQQAAAAGRPLNVWLTLPALPTGLDGEGMYVMQAALKYGVKIAGVNLMTMDYGNSAAPNPDAMGQYAIQAAQGLFGQLQGLYGTTLTAQQIWRMEGNTPMIGLNDVTSEVFSLQDAQELAAFAEQVGMGRISMWSLSRDIEDPERRPRLCRGSFQQHRAAALRVLDDLPGLRELRAGGRCPRLPRHQTALDLAASSHHQSRGSGLRSGQVRSSVSPSNSSPFFIT